MSERNWSDISEQDFPDDAVTKIDRGLFEAIRPYAEQAIPIRRDDLYLVTEGLLWGVVNALDVFGYRIVRKD